MNGVFYGWILIMVTLNPDGTLEGQGVNYYKEYKPCFEEMVKLSVLGKGKAYTCIDDYVNLNHEEG